MTALEPNPFRLTELTECGGCAAKLGADLLAEALAGLGAEAAAATDPSGPLIAGLDPPGPDRSQHDGSPIISP